MLKMVIEFNEDLIQLDNVFTVEYLYKKLDIAIERLNLSKVQDGIYTDSGNPMDLSSFFGMMAWLEKAGWFRRYAIRWDWYNDRLGSIKNVEPEDLMVNIYG